MFRVSLGMIAALASCFALGCSADADDASIEAGDDSVIVDTGSPRARAQYDANVAFALGYRAK